MQHLKNICREYLHSSMNWWDFGGSEVKVKVTLLPSHSRECNISRTTFFKFVRKCPLGVSDEVMRFWWSKVNDHCDLASSHSCEHNILRISEGNFFKFGTNSHFESRMNWIWWSKVKFTVPLRTSHFMNIDISRMPWGNFSKVGTNIRWTQRWTD